MPMMPIDMYAIPDLDFSGYTSTCSDDFHGANCDWNHWSPVVNWDSFPGHDGFHDLIDTVMHFTTPDDTETSPSAEACNSNSPTTTTSTTTTPDHEVVVAADDVEDDFKGLRLVHLLMAAAEALTGVNKSRDLARVILLRLKELVSPTHGSNMERLAAYFTHALHSLLEGAAGGAHNNNKHWNLIPYTHDHHNHNHDHDLLAAFQLLQDLSPYVKFAHFTANQAILEAVAHDRRVHIVDFDIMEGTQWASLMQALSSRKDGPHIRITALTRPGKRSSISTVQETGRRLTSFAASIGQPFSFHQCRVVDSDESFRPSALKLVRGEALVFNCMLHLPHHAFRPKKSIASFMEGAKALNARMVTLVEEEVGLGLGLGFVGPFMDTLHHYSAMFDSLEAGFPMQGRARALVERVFLGPRIAGSLGRIYYGCNGKKEEEEREGGSWGEWLGAAGYRGVEISFANHCQAKLLLGLFNHGYRVEELGRNKLVLGWQSRRLFSASIWTTSPSIST